MLEWIGAISDRDLLDDRDIRRLIEAGLSPWDIENAPDNLTAGEIIEYLSRSDS